jgi:drug/metabolite transporter (DMT)-like permease
VTPRKPFVIDLLLLTVVTVWGMNFAVMKVAYRSFHPIAFNAMRFLICSAAMAALMKLRPADARLSTKDIKDIVWLGFIINTVYQFLFVLGLERTKAGNAGLLLALVPIFAFLIGVLTKRESFSGRVVAGIVLSFVGVGAIVGAGSDGFSVGGTWIGDLMIIAAALCWGWYTARSVPLLMKYGWLAITGWMVIAGAVVLVPVSVPWLLAQNWQAIERSAWVALLYSSLLSIVYTYCIWAYALIQIGVTHTSMFSNITPIVGLFGGWLLLGEQPQFPQILGVALVLTGVFLVRSRRRVQREPVLNKRLKDVASPRN